MTALYLLAAEYRAAADKLADMDLDEQTVADTLESISGDLEVKACNVAAFARNMETTALAIKMAEEGMAARRKAIERRVASLRAYLLANMQTAGIKRIESPEFVITVRDNPPAVDAFAPEQIPDGYWTSPPPPPPVLNKTKIKEAIKSGEQVPGARLTQGQRLEIK
jgi:hypothetical protein